MTFDPDKYLADSFDPDEYLGEKAIGNKLPKAIGVPMAAGEAVMSMLGGLPAQIAGGLSGLGTLMTTGSLEKAANTSEAIQRSNFGFGQYKGSTDLGKQYAQNLGEAFAKPGEVAGDIGAAVGKQFGQEDLGRLSLQLPTDTFMNFLPLHTVTGGAKGLAKKTVDILRPKERVSKWDALPDKPVEPVVDSPLDKSAYDADVRRLADLEAQRRGESLAKFNAADEAQVARLEAELARRNEPQPTLIGDHNGQVLTPDNALVEQKLFDRKKQQYTQEAANFELQQRQTALEQEVARQQQLDFNAAERARQQQAPTGYDAWLEQMRTQERVPGNNATMDFEHSTAPYGLTESRIPEQGMDVSQFNAERMSAPLEKTMQENQAWHDLANDQARQAALDEAAYQKQLAQEKALDPVEQQLRDTAYVPTYDGQGPKTRAFKALSNKGKVNRQRGSVDARMLEDVGKAVKAVLSTADKYTSQLAKINIARLAPKDNADYAKQIPGMQNTLDKVVLRPESAEKLIEKGLTEADLPDPFFWSTQGFRNNLAMGPEMVGYKHGNSVVSGVSKWFQWQDKKADVAYREVVKPIEKLLTSLSKEDLSVLAEGLKREMFRTERFTDAELSQVLSPQLQEAYKQLRNGFDTVYEMQARNLEAQGRKVPTKAEAYLASMRGGDYHISVKNADGRPIWHVQARTVWEANKAVKWLRENVPEAKNVDWQHRKSNFATNIPKDVLGSFQELSKLLDDDSMGSIAIQEAIRKAQEDAGYDFRNQSDRFLQKQNVRGFDGDMPWLSPKENAIKLLENQVDYLNNSFNWAYMQEALGQIKDVLADPRLIEKQPHTVDYLKDVVRQQIGLGDFFTKTAEDAVSRTLGFSRGALGRGSRNLGMWTSLLQLGGNVGYAIATPLTALYSVGLHMKEGTLRPQAMANALLDTSSGIINHGLHSAGKAERMPMTELGREALKYAEDNGIVLKNMSDPHKLSVGTGERFVRNVLEPGIMVPEKIQRLSTFMTFVHGLKEQKGYLDTDGKTWVPFDNMYDVFQRAETLTNIAATNFRKSELPMATQKLGVLGEAGFKYKAPMLNYYNQLHTFARDFKNGNKKPLLAFLGMTAILGGVQNLPGIDLVDSAFEWFKKGVANWDSENYPKYKDLSVKGAIQNNLPSVVAYGAVQEALGTQMSQRFGTELGNLGDPLGNFPVASTIGSAFNAAGDLAHGNLPGAAWNIAPSLGKGILEANSDSFKAPNRQGGYVKASEAGDTAKVHILRNADDISKRQMGLRSSSEATQLEQRYRENKEAQNVKTASDKLINNLVNKAARGQKDQLPTYANAWLKLNVDGDLNAAISKGVQESTLTPEERKIAAAASLDALQRAKRVMEKRR